MALGISPGAYCESVDGGNSPPNVATALSATAVSFPDVSFFAVSIAVPLFLLLLSLLSGR